MQFLYFSDISFLRFGYNKKNINIARSVDKCCSVLGTKILCFCKRLDDVRRKLLLQLYVVLKVIFVPFIWKEHGFDRKYYCEMRKLFAAFGLLYLMGFGIILKLAKMKIFAIFGCLQSESKYLHTFDEEH